MKSYLKTQHIRAFIEPIVGETTVKTYFSYYGIFKDGLMFGLFRDDHFYLRTSSANLGEIQSLNTCHLEDKHIGIQAKNFYLIPLNQLSNRPLITSWISSTLNEMTEQIKQTEKLRKKLIRYLPNMDINIERRLRKLGIKSVDELVEKGEMNIFIELIKIGIEANDNLLFRLHGAINHKYAQTLTPSEKNTILQEANSALYNAGLRKRFNV